MKKCPYCAEKIQDKAIVCRYCGKSLTDAAPVQNLNIKKPQKKAPAWMVIAVMLVLMFLCWSIVTTQKQKDAAEAIALSQTQTAAPSPTTTNTPEPTATKDPDKLELSEIGVYEYGSQEAVKAALKAPSTAKFPSAVFGQDDWRLWKKGDMVTVQSWVDAQNSFGAMIRSKFTAQFSYSTQDLLYLEIDGKAVYGSPQ